MRRIAGTVGRSALFEQDTTEMTFPLPAAALLALTALAACSDAMHPIEAQLALLRPESITPIADLAYPAGTLLCPMTPYQNSVAGSAPQAQRINAFMGRQNYLGDDGIWSLVTVRPGTTGDDGIEHLVFRRSEYDVINAPAELKKLVEKVPANFEVLACVPVQHASVLATRSRATERKIVSFGRQHAP